MGEKVPEQIGPIEGSRIVLIQPNKWPPKEKKSQMKTFFSQDPSSSSLLPLQKSPTQEDVGSNLSFDIRVLET